MFANHSWPSFLSLIHNCTDFIGRVWENTLQKLFTLQSDNNKNCISHRKSIISTIAKVSHQLPECPTREDKEKIADFAWNRTESVNQQNKSQVNIKGKSIPKESFNLHNEMLIADPNRSMIWNMRTKYTISNGKSDFCSVKG